MEELEGLLSEGTIELSEGEPEKYFLTACLSEYFQIEEAQVPAGTQMGTDKAELSGGDFRRDRRFLSGYLSGCAERGISGLCGICILSCVSG